MSAAAWLLILSVTAQAPQKELVIAAVDTSTARLVRATEIAIYAPNGLCIRRGETGTFGEPFHAEDDQPFSPKYDRLRVTVRKARGFQVVEETLTIVLEPGQGWKPEAAGNVPDTIEIQLKLDPVPVYTHWTCGCGSSPDMLPCGMPPQLSPGAGFLPPVIAPEPTVSPQTVAPAQKDAGITGMGRPPVADFDWARYGAVWTRGGHGMYWQEQVIPRGAKP
jgi:hypothetical protein